MQFDTKIAIVIRTDLQAWQKLNAEMIEPLWSQGGGGGKRGKQ